jgi:hypothetical protein
MKMLVENIEELLFMHAMWKCFYRHAAKLAACRYITEHFRPSPKKHPRSIYGLKHDFERATVRYIPENDFADCLQQCGLKVIDGKVFAKIGDQHG